MKAVLQRKLQSLEGRLLSAQRRPLTARGTWAANVPKVAGVYGIWRRSSGKLVYVGETANLRSRFSDICRSVNHTFRRKAAVRLRLRGALTEAELSEALEARFDIAFIALDFGRTEVEEYLVMRYRKTVWNKEAPRVKRAGQYDWVVPI